MLAEWRTEKITIHHLANGIRLYKEEKERDCLIW